MKRLLSVLFLFFALASSANVEVLQFESSEQEQRYNALIKELRCLVCQNQNLADSNADLAKDLRDKTYQMIRAGKPDSEIVAYMVDRYGDFVLYRPPVKPTTVFLWVGPFVILLVGLMVLMRVIRHRRSQAAATIDPQQREQAQRLLRED